MKRTLIALAALSLCMVGRAHAQTSLADPCTQYASLSVTKSINSATTTALVVPPTTGSVTVCNFLIEHPGGTGTMALEYGSGTACATGATLLKAAFAYNTTAGTPTVEAQTLTMPVPMSNGVCALSTGTIVQTVTVNYVVH